MDYVILKIDDKGNTSRERTSEDLETFVLNITFLRLDGLSLQQIAEKLYASKTSISDHIKRYRPVFYLYNYRKVIINPSTGKSYDLATVWEMLEKGFGVAEAAKASGISVAGVRNLLIDNNALPEFDETKIWNFLMDLKSIQWISDYFGHSLTDIKRFKKKKEINVPTRQERITLYKEKNFTRSIDSDTLRDSSAFLLNPQYNEAIDEKLTSKELIEAFNADYEKCLAGYPLIIKKYLSDSYDDIKTKDEEKIQNMLQSATKDYFSLNYELYRKYQYGHADLRNFFCNTAAVFTECSRPTVAPDLVVGTGWLKEKYYLTEHHVIRASHTWGCGYLFNDWVLKGKDETYYGLAPNHPVHFRTLRYGMAEFDDFVFRTKVRQNKMLLSFANTVFGDAFQYKGKTELGNFASRGFDITNYLKPYHV